MISSSTLNQPQPMLMPAFSGNCVSGTVCLRDSPKLCAIGQSINPDAEPGDAVTAAIAHQTKGENNSDAEKAPSARARRNRE